MGKSENEQLRASSDVSSANSLPQKGGKEQRREARYLVSWRVSISIEGQHLHYGRTKDISLHGISILNDLNPKPGTRVTLNIHIPTLNKSCKPHVLIVHGTTSYTVHDSDILCFRIGICFAKFEHESDRAYLAERITNHHVQAPDYVCRRSTDQKI